MGYGGKHVRFSADRPVLRGRNQHYLRSGRPKIRYEALEDARLVVAEMRAEGKDVQAYLCGECQGHHVGNKRHIDLLPDRQVAMYGELGERAYAHMRVQNRQYKKRLAEIMKVIRRAEDKRLWGTQNVNPKSHTKPRSN